MSGCWLAKSDSVYWANQQRNSFLYIFRMVYLINGERWTRNTWGTSTENRCLATGWRRHTQSAASPSGPNHFQSSFTAVQHIDVRRETRNRCLSIDNDWNQDRCTRSVNGALIWYWCPANSWWNQTWFEVPPSGRNHWRSTFGWHNKWTIRNRQETSLQCC
jgi:hypothetical protein